MKLFIRLYPEASWVQVVGMSKYKREYVPNVYAYSKTLPLDIEKCVDYCKKHDIEWRVEQ